MRRLARVLVAVTSVLTALAISPLVPGSGLNDRLIPDVLAVEQVIAGGGGSANADTAFVQRMLFDTPMRSFTRAATSHIGPDGRSGDGWFDWSTDLCSAPLVGNSGRSFDFTEPCRRHDFGYRNTKLFDQRYGAGRAWNSAARKQIDRQFLTDMLAHCSARWIIDRPPCMSWAYTYYGAVRVAGGP